MNTVVYYPHTFPTTDWLKLAALCWDEVYRLRSRDADDDPEPIQELNEKLGGLLKSIDVGTLARESTRLMNKFTEWLNLRIEDFKSKDKTLNKYGFVDLFPGKLPNTHMVNFLQKQGFAEYKARTYNEQTLKWLRDIPRNISLRQARELSKRKRSPDEIRLDELEEEIEEAKWLRKKGVVKKLEKERQELLERNLITITKKERVFYVREDVALQYLSLFAAKVASDQNSDLVAEGSEFTDIVFHDVRKIRGEVATTVLKAYVPKKLQTLDTQHIAEFRSKFALKRLKYQKAVQSIVNEYAEVASERQLGQLKKRIINLAKERVEDTKKGFRRAKLSIVTKTLGVSLTPPALATYIASALGIGIFALPE